MESEKRKQYRKQWYLDNKERCNRSLGLFYDNPELIEKVFKYLKGI